MSTLNLSLLLAVITLFTVQTQAQTINLLGNDTSFCESTMLLSTPSGYHSFEWITGSMDSAILAYNPGQYSVTTTYF
jgi:hypothetical protein